MVHLEILADGVKLFKVINMETGYEEGLDTGELDNKAVDEIQCR